MRTAIDWTKAQRLIGAGVDGSPGRETYGKLMAKAVGRSYPGTVFTALGDSAALHFRNYDVTTVERVAGVIAECAHECANFTRFEENLSYSAQGLADTWPGRYAVNPKAATKKPNARALQLARRPQDIANDTYGLRMQNQSPADDNDTDPDGWQYRGRGPGMLTGKGAYRAMGTALGLDLIRYPDLAAEPGTGLLITLEFMREKGMFVLMDKGDHQAERRAWNGGLIGFAEVEAIRATVTKLLPALF